MSELFITWIMWAIVSTANPNVNIVAVLDEFPEHDTCVGIAKQVALSGAEDIEVKKILGVDSITVVCVPVLTRESNDTLLDGKPKKHLRTEPVG